MSTVTEAVPFSVLPTIENHRQRILKIRGVLRFNGTSLELEHQTTNTRLEIGEPVTTVLQLDDLAAVEFKKGWFRARIVVDTTSLSVFDGVPGAEAQQLVLHIVRKDRDRAMRAAWNIQAALENRKLPAAE